LGSLKNISGGQDTGQIRFNKSDSSVYVWNGRAWIKAGGGTIPTLTQVLESAAGANEAGANQIKDLSAGTSQNDAATFGQLTDTANLRLRISDTASMLSAYAKTAAVALKLNISDTATMLAPYSRVSVTSYGKNAGRDSTILLLSNGTRYAAKDSVGGGGGGGMAIGGTITSATAGSVLFAGTSGVLQQDNSGFFWDNANNRLGIGTATPATQLHLLQSSGSNTMRMTTSPAGGNVIEFRNTDNSTMGAILATGASFLYGTYLTNQLNLNGVSGGVGLRTPTAGNINFYAGNTDPDFGVNYFRMFGANGNSHFQNGGTYTDIASARLAVNSTTQGVLFPRMTLTQRNAIASPAAGLQVIVTGETGGEFLSFYNSSTAAWQRVVKLTSAGRLLLGTTTESTHILDVVGTQRITGQILSTVSGNSALKIQSNSWFELSANDIISATGSSLIGGSTPGMGIRYGTAITFGTGGIGYHYLTNNYALFSSQSSAVNLSSGVPASAVLEARSTTQGFLPPRMTTVQKLAIGTPAAGLQVYDTTLNQMSYYNGTTWVNF
jgi:hypothetical protein